MAALERVEPAPQRDDRPKTLGGIGGLGPSRKLAEFVRHGALISAGEARQTQLTSLAGDRIGKNRRVIALLDDRSSLRVRALALLAVVVAVLVLAAAAPVDDAEAGQGGDNTAAAINTEDGSTVFDFTFSIRRLAGDVVENQNAAVALASCESCQTVAVAIQVVLVESTPSTITPVNAAIALNEECTACTTVALAYQYVLGVGEPLRFTKEGRERIRDIRKEFMRLERSDLSLAEVLARVAELRAQLVDVLNTQLEVDDGSGGEDRDGVDESDEDRGGGDADSDSDGEPQGTDGGPPAGGDDAADAPGGTAGDDSAPPAQDTGTGSEAPAEGAEAPPGASGQPAP